MAAFGTVAIGIDLGTTYSCIGVWHNGGVEIIANEVGNRTTPSIVSFIDNSHVVGEAAKVQDVINASNTIFGIKRIIGRQYNDNVVTGLKENWPFRVVSGDNGKAAVQIQVNGETKTYLPEMISSMVLTKLKETAETFLGQPVSHAVITVPAYFNNAQRQATKNAGMLCGLNVMRIINEPTAAAIAYGLDKRDCTRKVLIFDIGGGTLDVSLLSVDGEIFEVIATSGDSNLGGEDFDDNIAKYLAASFKTKHKKNIATTSTAFKRLKNAAERAKRTLSFSSVAQIELDSLESVDFNISLTRAKFEELNTDLFNRCMKPVEQVLRDGKTKKEKIDDIVLVGGSSRIPKIQSILSEFFNGRQLYKNINPDEAIAYGATVQAAILTGTQSDTLSNVILVDVTSLSLGIEILGERMSTVIPRNTNIPNRITQQYVTCKDNQTSVSIEIYEGERELVTDNFKLGEFLIEGLRPMPSGETVIDVTFEIDSNGILRVHAIEKTSGIRGKVTISTKDRNLTIEEINMIVNEAEQHREEDQIKRNRIEARILLEEYIHNLEIAVRKHQIPSWNRRTVDSLIDETKSWIRINYESDSSILFEKREELKIIVAALASGLKLGRDENYGQFPIDDTESVGGGKRYGGNGSNDID